MPDIQLDERIWRRVYAESLRHSLSLWWCSFASEDAFLGIAIVEAIGDKGARRRCRDLGIDPGGEMLAHPVPWDEDRPPDNYLNRLLSYAELMSPEGKAVFGDLLCPDELSEEEFEVAQDIHTLIQDDQT